MSFPAASLGSLTPAAFLARRPRAVVVASLVALAVSLAAVLFNPAWTDEVFYADPGACLAMGRGFLSNGVSPLGFGAPWGLSNPGLPLLLAGWFRLFGFGQFAAHAFFFVVQLAGTALCLRWVGRRHALPAWGALAALAAGMTLHSLAGNTIFHARHDAFAALLFAWFLEGMFPVRPSGARHFLLFALGLACVFLGLQFCGFFALAAAGTFLWRRDRGSFLAGLSLAAGMAVGLLLLRWAYGEMGVWQAFLAHRADNFGRAFRPDKFYVSKEFLVFFPACLLLVLTEGLAGRGWRNEVAKAGWCGLLLLLGVPVLIQFVGLWQSPFSWMVAAPLLLAALPVCVAAPFSRGGWFVGVVAGLVLFSCAFRVRELPLAVREAGRRADVVAEFRRLSGPSDAALGSMSLFYGLRASGRPVYWPYDRYQPMHPGLVAAARWLVLAEADRAIVLELIGGEWEQAYATDQAEPRGPQGPYVILRRKAPAR